MRRTTSRWALVAASLLLCTGFEWPGRLPRLTYELSHGAPEVRRDAARSLGDYAAADVAEALLDALEDPDAAVRLAAASSLGRVKALQAAPLLLQWVDDAQAQVRAAALRALGELGDARARGAVARAFADADLDVRRAAVQAARALSGDDMITALIGALGDRDPGLRRAVIEALAGSSDTRLFEALSPRAHDDSVEVKAAALRALGALRDRRALPLLVQALAQPVEELQLAALAGLHSLADAEALQALESALDGPPRVAKAAVSALAAIDHERALAMLVAQLGRPDVAATAAAALRERLIRLHVHGDPRTAQVVAEIAGRVESAETAAEVTRLAEALLVLSPSAAIDPAAAALVTALQSGRGDVAIVGRALCATKIPDALLPLLEQLERAEEARRPLVLDALDACMTSLPGDGRAVEPLLAALGRSRGEERGRLLRLVGLTRSPRALGPLAGILSAREPRLRAIALRAIHELPGTDSAPIVTPLLADLDAEVRFEAGRALGRSLDADGARALLATLVSEEPADRHAVLTALGGGLPRLSRRGELDAPTRDLAVKSLATLLVGDDDGLAAASLDALRRLAPQGGAGIVARLLRSPSTRRRSAALLSLGSFDGDDTRKLLRYMLDHTPARLGPAVAAALGEVGDQRDVAALARAGNRMRWPMRGAVAFALARLAARGALKPRSAQRTLCELARSRDPYVRANVAAGLARLHAGPCEGGPDPLRWLTDARSAAVRAAAAAWLARAPGMPRAEVDRALSLCASDLDETVASACARARVADEPAGAAPSTADVYAYDVDGQTLLRDRLVAVRLPDASVFVGYTDPNGHLLLRNVPAGALLLEDPANAPFEPR